jgi:S1-C subfamily serine protease
MRTFSLFIFVMLLLNVVIGVDAYRKAEHAHATLHAQVLASTRDGVSEAVVPCLPLVVEITTSRSDAEGILTVSGYGSGVVVGHHGYIVTCWHVVEGEQSFTVGDAPAVLIAKDEVRDLALIKVEQEFTSTAVWGDSLSLLPGDFVFALGYPLAIDELATFGGVSAVLWYLDGKPFIITDASINPGNSGGGLFDSRGALVGLPSNTYVVEGIPRNINLAIPGNEVRAFVVSNGGDK